MTSVPDGEIVSGRMTLSSARSGRALMRSSSLLRPTILTICEGDSVTRTGSSHASRRPALGRCSRARSTEPAGFPSQWTSTRWPNSQRIDRNEEALLCLNNRPANCFLPSYDRPFRFGADTTSRSLIVAAARDRVRCSAKRRRSDAPLSLQLKRSQRIGDSAA